MSWRFAAVLFLTIGLSLLLCAALTSRWDRVPSKEHARVNPLGGRPDATVAGALIYREHCAQCHPYDPMGDGCKKPSLRSDHVRSATDGDLEWFLCQGDLAHGMPSWSSLPEDKRWQLVAYLRSIQ